MTTAFAGARWALVVALAAMALPAAAQQVPPPSYASFSERLPCVHRIGRCFDATIGGKPVEVIADKAEFDKLKALLQTLNSNVRDVHWVVRDPVPGAQALDVATRATTLGLPHVGDEKEEPDTAFGDFDKAFPQAPVTLDAHYRTPDQSHAAMEPHASMAAWDGDEVKVWTSSQMIDWWHTDLAIVLDMDKEKIRLISPYIGGGFGITGHQHHRHPELACQRRIVTAWEQSAGDADGGL